MSSNFSTSIKLHSSLVIKCHFLQAIWDLFKKAVDVIFNVFHVIWDIFIQRL